MTALKQEAVKIIENIHEDSMAQVIAYLKSFSSEEKSYEKRLAGFQGLISFAGTLPEDFDYKKELEEAREEKYARFI